MKHHPEITDSMIEIFISVILGGEIDKLRAADLVRKLDDEARRGLQAACAQVDDLTDKIILEELREESA